MRLKWFSVAAVVLLALPSFAARQQATRETSHENELIREVLDMERAAKEAALHNDAAYAERALAQDYLAIGPLGNVLTKDDSVSAHRNADLHYDSIDVSEMTVRIYGDTAVVMARADVKGKNLGEDFSGPYRFTRVWVKRNGRWQAVSYQATATR